MTRVSPAAPLLLTHQPMAAMNYRRAAEAALVAGTGLTSAPSLPVPSDGAGAVPDSPPQQKSG